MGKTTMRYVWEQRVTLYKSSAQSLSTWCEANDVKPARLRYWIRELEDKHTVSEKVTSWITVDATELKSSTNDNSDSLVVKIGAASIQLNSGFNKDLFSKVTEVLLLLC